MVVKGDKYFIVSWTIILVFKDWKINPAIENMDVFFIWIHF
jgi:hypothetical protein